MSITLGSLELNPSVQWTDRYDHNAVAQGITQLLGSVPYVVEVAKQKGRAITLVATEETGWFSKSMVEGIIAMAAVANTSYVLSFEGVDYNIKFDRRNGSPYHFEPILYQEPQPDGAWFTGTVHLFTI